MMNVRKMALVGLCMATLGAPLAAQAGEVAHREAVQENRIYQGVRNGSLSPREYDRLQRQETRLNNRRVEDLQNGNGHLTGAQFRQFNREENHLSGRIYRTKHDINHP